METLLKVFGRRAFVKLSMVPAVAGLFGLGCGSDSEGGVHGGYGDYYGYDDHDGYGGYGGYDGYGGYGRGGRYGYDY